MRRKIVLISLCLIALIVSTYAQNTATANKENTEETSQNQKKKSRLILGGYGEAVMTRNFYSDNFNRYSKAEDYKDAKGHGQFDLPHVVVMIGYDFGKGWTMGTEIEFEHGGTESLKKQASGRKKLNAVVKSLWNNFGFRNRSGKVLTFAEDIW